MLCTYRYSVILIEVAAVNVTIRAACQVSMCTSQRQSAPRRMLPLVLEVLEVHDTHDNGISHVQRQSPTAESSLSSTNGMSAILRALQGFRRYKGELTQTTNRHVSVHSLHFIDPHINSKLLRCIGKPCARSVGL